MKHLGDITKISGYTAPIVDCVIGGSPCQDLSVAGKRAGLAGERSGLYMEQIRIVREMRDRDRNSGRTGKFICPRYMVWENVPGAFSSNNRADFAAVIEEIIKTAEPGAAVSVCVPDGGWTKSGCYYSENGSWSLAWRVHDAQFWGVPQRRKRIALVADFGGLTAPEILFERKGLSRDIDQSAAQREETAGTAGSSTAGAISFQERAGCPRGGKGILIQPERTGALSMLNNQSVCYGLDHVMLSGGTTYQGRGYYDDVSGCLKTQAHGVMCLNDQGGSVMSVSNDVSGCLRAQEHGHQPIVAGFKAGQSMAGGIGYQEECAATLSSQMSGTEPTVFDARGNGDGKIACTITGDHESRVTDYTALCLDVGFFNAYEEKCAALLARQYKDLPVVNSHLVRRLTPLECERLQGFPDGWTDIGEWVDSKGKRHKEADSPRYKALGNSIALPFWKYLLKRMCAQYERDATMASLFDGIGGFPLIWEQINGKGSCLWASEIEEFPIAVTKYHFGE